MSTGLECEIFAYKGDWFYVLQDWDCPVGAWDWREYATPYGPFGSEELAKQHIFDNHANPGGWSVTDYGDGPIDGMTAALIEKAKS